jgi:hypothetical protein
MSLECRPSRAGLPRDVRHSCPSLSQLDLSLTLVPAGALCSLAHSLLTSFLTRQGFTVTPSFVLHTAFKAEFTYPPPPSASRFSSSEASSGFSGGDLRRCFGLSKKGRVSENVEGKSVGVEVGKDKGKGRMIVLQSEYDALPVRLPTFASKVLRACKGSTLAKSGAFSYDTQGLGHACGRPSLKASLFSPLLLNSFSSLLSSLPRQPDSHFRHPRPPDPPPRSHHPPHPRHPCPARDPSRGRWRREDSPPQIGSVRRSECGVDVSSWSRENGGGEKLGEREAKFGDPDVECGFQGEEVSAVWVLGAGLVGRCKINRLMRRFSVVLTLLEHLGSESWALLLPLSPSSLQVGSLS